MQQDCKTVIIINFHRGNSRALSARELMIMARIVELLRETAPAAAAAVPSNRQSFAGSEHCVLVALADSVQRYRAVHTACYQSPRDCDGTVAGYRPASPSNEGGG